MASSNNEPVTEMELKAKAVAPRVTPEQIEGQIAFVSYTNGYDLMMDAAHHVTDGEGVHIHSMKLSTGELGGVLTRFTVCMIILKNGFIVTGTSAPASGANFDANIGERLAYQDAFNKLWPLFGFELKQRLYKENVQ